MKPYSYQMDAAKQLATKLRFMIAADMGVGKTIIALEAIKLLNHPTVCVVCPAIAVTNWAREIERWDCDLNKFTIISYDKARSLSLRQEICSKGIEILILDEAHYLKNKSAARTQAIYGEAGLARKIKKVWLLSGTFAPNNASELYTHLRTLFNDHLPDCAKSYQGFLQHFCKVKLVPVRSNAPGQKYIEQVYGNKNVAQIKDILQQVSLKIKAADVLPELPALRWSTLTMSYGRLKPLANVKPEDIQSFRYWLNDSADNGASGIMNPSDHRTPHFMKLRRQLSLAKTEPVSRWLNDFLSSSTEKIVVFGIHLQPLGDLHAQFKNTSVYLHGAVPTKKRGLLVAEFQGNPDIRIFFGQLNTCNTAITLTAASHILFLEQSFVPGENLQAASRCHRIGQPHSVLAQVVTMANSIDGAVDSILLQKNIMLQELDYENENKCHA